MTPAVISIIILVVCIVLFITRLIPNAATACLGCLLFALTGVCTFDQAFSGFSNNIVILMFGMMVMGIAMEDTGAAKIIGRYVTKWSKNNERMFMFLAGTVSAALSTFMSNTAVIAIFLPIIESVSRSSNLMGRKNLTLPVTMGAMFGGVCTLVGSTPQLTANGILSEMTGQELGMFDYTLPGVIIFAVYMLFIQFIGYRSGKKIWGDDAGDVDLGASDVITEENYTVNKRKLILMLAIFVITIVLFVGAWVSAAMTAVISAMLCIVTGCTNTKVVFKKMDWSVVFILAGCLGLASGIAKGGVGDLIADLMSDILVPEIPAIVIFAIFVLLAMLISNFITNSTAVVIVLPIALAVCQARGLSPLAFTLGIVYSANLTFSTPLANAQTAMTLVAGYKFSDYIRYTWPLALLVYLSIVIFVPLIFPLV